jgi:FMN phosphatase YigB (HAD superfamily)
MNAVIFDIDGTIADIEHRRHFVRSKPKNWPAFVRGIKDDKPYTDIIWLMNTLYHMGTKILIASGRSENDRKDTVAWLEAQHIWQRPSLTETGRDVTEYEKLYMRASGDYRDDTIVKREILDVMRSDGFDPRMAIDDRNKVVDMWREAGLRCLQVAPGDF